MRVIVAGGRKFNPTIEQSLWLDKKLIEIKATTVISGGATGADRFGEIHARLLGIRLIIHRALWDKYGPSAGPIRNELMAQNADACILFPGGKGTENMKKLAKNYGLKIIEWGDE